VRERFFWSALVGFCCALLLAPALAPASISRARLDRGLSRQMKHAGGAGGAFVTDIDARRNRTLFSFASHRPRVLASNTKLFTTAAVLNRFGADGHFYTTLYAHPSNAVHGHTLRGDLVIVGAGDPALAGSGFARRNGLPLTPLGELAREVRNAGITRVTGDVRADDTAFDRRRGIPTGGVDASGELGPLSGLSFDSGFDGGHYASAPELVAAGALKAKLHQLGVHVKGETGRTKLPHRVLARKPLASVASPRIADLIAATNHPSNNFFAEMLLKRLASRPGVKGTTRRGAHKVEKFAHKLGTHVRMNNGSGLSLSDRASPRQVGRLLSAMRERPDAGDFRLSLPLAGHEGTVAHRMVGTAADGRCRTKTGTLSDVSALSGYCHAGHGLVAFSILMNSVNVDSAQAAQDKMAALIARYKR
jgi:serine-type D-Ala-D-Ala carboxypeptidase/endopeptidase (penicillin-binding protein 4)